MVTKTDETLESEFSKVMDVIGKLSVDDQRRVFGQLSRRFADRSEEAPIYDHMGKVAGYFVPEELRIRLTTVEFRRELQESSANPGETRPLKETIARLKAQHKTK